MPKRRGASFCDRCGERIQSGRRGYRLDTPRCPNYVQHRTDDTIALMRRINANRPEPVVIPSGAYNRIAWYNDGGEAMPATSTQHPIEEIR